MGTRADKALGATMLLCAAAAVALGWTGFIASDDASYYGGALRWLQDPPYGGDDHWTTRYPVLWSLAAALAVFGRGEAAFGVTALLWYFTFLATAGVLAWRIGGARVAAIATLLLSTLPLIATAGSITGCDLPEASFLLAGALLLLPPRDGTPTSSARAFAAGLCFGIAVLSRETALLALAGLGMLFLLGRPVPRAALLWAALGGAAVLLGEAAFQMAVTGDPLHRYAVAFNHDSTIDRAANEEGNLLVHPVIDPLLVLLVNNEFGLLFWLAGAALGLGLLTRLTPEERSRLAVPAALGLSCFLLVAVLHGKLVLNPRYFTLTAVLAALIAALFLARCSAGVRTAVLVPVVALNLLLLSAQNHRPWWASQALPAVAAAHGGRAITTSPEILHRARQRLAWAGLSNVGAVPTPGALRFVAAEEPAAGWRVVQRIDSPPTRLGAALIATGLGEHLPPQVETRLLRPNGSAFLLEPAR